MLTFHVIPKWNVQNTHIRKYEYMWEKILENGKKLHKIETLKEAPLQNQSFSPKKQSFQFIIYGFSRIVPLQHTTQTEKQKIKQFLLGLVKTEINNQKSLVSFELK